MIETDPRVEIEKLDESIRQQEKMKAVGSMPTELADASIDGLKSKRAMYQAQFEGSGAIAQGDGATLIAGNTGTVVVIASDSAHVVICDQPVEMKPELRNKAIHFRPETDSNDKKLALDTINCMK